MRPFSRIYGLYILAFITGMAGNICVLFTANDAHMRGFEIHVPADCIASNTKADNDYVLRQLNDVFKIKISNSRRIL